MTALPRKLQIKSGMNGRVLNLPDGIDLGITQQIRTGHASGHYVVVFVSNQAQLAASLDAALDKLSEDGLLWFCYLKMSSGIVSDINRDHGWQPLKDRGYRGVRQISIDSTWSAWRFRQHQFIKPSKD